LVEVEVEALTGPGTLERLRATWREFLTIADDDARALTRLARRWCRILGINPEPRRAGLLPLPPAGLPRDRRCRERGLPAAAPQRSPR
jgi:hypothetical protein